METDRLKVCPSEKQHHADSVPGRRCKTVAAARL
jgi:hypothetical protein